MSKNYKECDYDERITRFELFPDLYGMSNDEYEKIVYKKAVQIKRFFRENGFNVTLDAIKHQLRNWSYDYKSGYRDEKNGYHLFSPCGCNPLSIRLSTLCDEYKDWQETYYA